MMRRRPGDGRRSAQQNRLLLAFAIILLPWLQLADAQQQQQQQRNQAPHAIHSGSPHANHDAHNDRVSLDDAARWAASSIDAVTSQPPEATAGAPKSRYTARASSRQNQKRKIINPDDESALATLAPAESVRAPRPPSDLRPRSIPASGLTSTQNARNLEDWEVEDFVLLATVDGDLYANDRNTGKERWHLEVDLPMVETKHYRNNNSADQDYNPVDHYLWVVEPNSNGGIFIWRPDLEAGLIRTGFTMKSLVEQLSPYSDEEAQIVYTGDKKTTMVTIDAATGQVLKWFGSSGAHVNRDDFCRQANTFEDADNEECLTRGTITLGRTEYTVGIQGSDSRPIATLKYSEWGPNTYDSDLYLQYHTSLDKRYITSRHDGKIYAFDQSRADKTTTLFSNKFAAPVASVFDVCRSWETSGSGNNPQLVVLPQPPMPARDKSEKLMRSNSIFLNQTETGSWYAMSGQAYPLIIDAPLAQIASPEWWSILPSVDTISQAKLERALVGNHFLESIRGDNHQFPSLPGRSGEEVVQRPAPNMATGGAEPPDSTDEPTIITKVKSLPQSAANSVVDFVSNPILIILFFVAIVYNQKKLRRSYHRLRSNGFQKGLVQEVQTLFFSETLPEEKSSIVTGEKQDEAVKEDDVVKNENDAQVKSGDELAKAAEPPTLKEESSDLADQQKTPGSETKAGEEQANDLEPPETPAKSKKKAHRGRRGGVKHRPKKQSEHSQSRGDEPDVSTVEEAVKNAKRLGDRPSLQPDVMTVHNDMSAVTNPIMRMGNIEVNTEEQLGTGSNGTLVFAGRFDGRDVAVKRMLIQFYDIASQETRLLRESDDHPNGKKTIQV